MNVRILAPWFPSARAYRFFRWSRTFFLVVGGLALGYSGFVILESKIYQAIQIHRFQNELESTKLLVGNATEPSPSRSPCPS